MKPFGPRQVSGKEPKGPQDRSRSLQGYERPVSHRLRRRLGGPGGSRFLIVASDCPSRPRPLPLCFVGGPSRAFGGRGKAAARTNLPGVGSRGLTYPEVRGGESGTHCPLTLECTPTYSSLTGENRIAKHPPRRKDATLGWYVLPVSVNWTYVQYR